jgi:hypothetical protein
MIRHAKEHDFTNNIWQEHACHLLNDEFIALLDASDVPEASYLEMMQALADDFDARRSSCTPLLGAYLDHLVPSMRAWTAALAAAAPG